MTINSLSSQALEKICSYLQDADLKAFMKAFEETSEKVQTVARNELENRDKELEQLLSPYEAPRTFNITRLKEANLLLIGDRNGNHQYLAARSALLYFLARRGPVILVKEGVPSMQTCNASEAEICGVKRSFALDPQSLNPTFKENIHAIGWDNLEEFDRLDHAIDQKYSELEQSIHDTRRSFVKQLPNELRLSDSEWDELGSILFSNHTRDEYVYHYWHYLEFSMELYKLRKTEIQFLGYLDLINSYLTNLDATKETPRTEDFEGLVKIYSNKDLEEATREELKMFVEDINGRESTKDLVKRYKTIKIINAIINMFERYDEAEPLFSSLKTEQTDRLELKKQFLRILPDLLRNWNSLEIGEEEQLKLPISMFMNKLKFFKTHLLKNISIEELKELLSHLEKYNKINLEYAEFRYKLIIGKREDRLDAIEQTFPIRTRSMANTLSKIDNYMSSLGLQQSMIVLVADNNYLVNNKTSSEYDLTTFYEELNKHKAAILIPSVPTINSLNSSALEKICTYLQDVDLKAFGKTSQKMQTVARNELEKRDKELEQLLFPYEVPRMFNITTLKDAKLLLVADEHGNEQYASDRSALLYFLARRGPVVFVTEGMSSMEKVKDIHCRGVTINRRMPAMIQPQSLSPTFKENVHAIGWDDQEELRRLDQAIEEKYSEQQKAIDDARTSLIQQLPDDLRLSDSEWNEQKNSLSHLFPGYTFKQDFDQLSFPIELYKLRKKEIHFLQYYLADGKKYFECLDSTKQSPRIEDFEEKDFNENQIGIVDVCSNDELEDLTKKELEEFIKMENISQGAGILHKRSNPGYAMGILYSIISFFEVCDETEQLFFSLKTQQTDCSELESKIVSNLLMVNAHWHSLRIFWHLINNVNEIKTKEPPDRSSLASLVSDEPSLTIFMKKLKLIRTHFMQETSVDSLKELRSRLEIYHAINIDQDALISKKRTDYSAALTKTFPSRTASMVNTLRKIDGYILSLGLQHPMIVLGAGRDHLMNNSKESEYDLTSLYEELNNHKAAILIPPGIMVTEENSEVKPEPATTS